MSGRLAIVGIGPGDPAHATGRAATVLAEAEMLLGYTTYLGRITPRPGQIVMPSDNREELARAHDALTLACDGHSVALVSSGDPGVFAMASAVMEALDHGPNAFRALNIEVVPGVTAMLAAASRLGAPLGHDFCAMSLSDNLKPWTLVLSRIASAASAGFVIALYNACSRARPWQLDAAFAHLRTILAPTIPVAFVTAATRPDERIDITTLLGARGDQADMRTLVVIGTEACRIVKRPGRSPLLYAPRHA